MDKVTQAERKLAGLCLDCGLSESATVQEHNVLCDIRIAKEDEIHKARQDKLVGFAFTYAIQEASKVYATERFDILAARRKAERQKDNG